MSTVNNKGTESTPEWKIKEVEEVREWIGGQRCVGICEVSGVPSRQFQLIRSALRGEVSIKVGRNTLVRRAFGEVKELEGMLEYISGQVGVVGTDKNPFALYQMFKNSRTAAPINAGDVAEVKIIIPVGDTGFPPGPFVGDLQAVGASAQILEGSIKVTEPSVVAEVGDTVTPQLANVLSSLGIEPKVVGLKLKAVFSEGTLYEIDVLDIDTEMYKSKMTLAANNARSLSMASNYPTSETIASLLLKGLLDARSVGFSAVIESPDLVAEIISKTAIESQGFAMSLEEGARPKHLKGAVKNTPTEEIEQSSEQNKSEAPKDEESDNEEAAAAGLGDLFG